MHKHSNSIFLLTHPSTFATSSPRCLPTSQPTRKRLLSISSSGFIQSTLDLHFAIHNQRIAGMPVTKLTDTLHQTMILLQHVNCISCRNINFPLSKVKEIWVMSRVLIMNTTIKHCILNTLSLFHWPELGRFAVLCTSSLNKKYIQFLDWCVLTHPDSFTLTYYVHLITRVVGGSSVHKVICKIINCIMD